MGHRHALCAIAGNHKIIKAVGNTEREGKLVQIVLIVGDLVVAKGCGIEDKRIATSAALERIIADATRNGVGKGIARAGKVCNSRVSQVFNRREG